MTYTLTDADRKRLRGQTLAIVERLSFGPAFNYDLARISLKYTSRVSDARERGYRIRCVREGDGGVTRYELEGWSDPNAAKGEQLGLFGAHALAADFTSTGGR